MAVFRRLTGIQGSEVRFGDDPPRRLLNPKRCQRDSPAIRCWLARDDEQDPVGEFNE